MKCDISKSGILTCPLDNIYSSGSDINFLCAWLLPVPLALILSQNKLRTDGHVKNKPFVRGPTQLVTKGSMVPICKSIGELVSLANKS